MGEAVESARGADRFAALLQKGISMVLASDNDSVSTSSSSEPSETLDWGLDLDKMGEEDELLSVHSEITAGTAKSNEKSHEEVKDFFIEELPVSEGHDGESAVEQLVIEPQVSKQVPVERVATPKEQVKKKKKPGFSFKKIDKRLSDVAKQKHPIVTEGDDRGMDVFDDVSSVLSRPIQIHQERPVSPTNSAPVVVEIDASESRNQSKSPSLSTRKARKEKNSPPASKSRKSTISTRSRRSSAMASTIPSDDLGIEDDRLDSYADDTKAESPDDFPDVNSLSREIEPENEGKVEKKLFRKKQIKDSKPVVSSSKSSGSGIRSSSKRKRRETFRLVDFAHQRHVIESDSACEQEGLRRSKRTRRKPLQYWKNERLIYEAGESGIAAVLPIPKGEILYEGEPETKRKTKKVHRNSKKPASKIPAELEIDRTRKMEHALPVFNPSLNKELLETVGLSEGQLKFQSVDQGVEVAKVFDQDNFMCGILKLSPGACKSPDTVKSPEILMVQSCPPNGLLVKMNDSECQYSCGDWFWVPPGFTYSLKNQASNTPIKLAFSVISTSE